MSEKLYTITRFDGKTFKNFKKKESEMTEDDILYFYKKIGEAYNEAPHAAKVLFMTEAIPPFQEYMDRISGGSDVKN